MRRVGYGFEKKHSSTHARRTRLLAARRGCTRPVPAVPADKSLAQTMDLNIFTLSSKILRNNILCFIPEIVGAIAHNIYENNVYDLFQVSNNYLIALF
jgi:hypothetical protein